MTTKSPASQMLESVLAGQDPRRVVRQSLTEKKFANERALPKHPAAAKVGADCLFAIREEDLEGEGSDSEAVYAVRAKIMKIGKDADYGETVHVKLMEPLPEADMKSGQTEGPCQWDPEYGVAWDAGYL